MTESKTSSSSSLLPPLLLKDDELLDWTKHKENIQTLDCVLTPVLADIVDFDQNHAQVRLQLTEEIERLVATFATKHPEMAKKLQYEADEKLFLAKAQKVHAAVAKTEDYKKCMELIEDESPRLIHITYDSLIFYILYNRHSGMPAYDKLVFDGIVPEIDKLLDDWISRVGPYTVHSRAIYQLINFAGVNTMFDTFMTYVSKKVQDVEPPHAEGFIEECLMRKKLDLAVQLCQKWSSPKRSKLADWLRDIGRNFDRILTREEIETMREKIDLDPEQLDKLHPGRIRRKDGNERIWKRREIKFREFDEHDWWMS